MVQADRTGSGEDEEQENEAEKICWFAAVSGGEKTLRRVHDEITDRHFSRSDEGSWPGEETKQDQRLAKSSIVPAQPCIVARLIP